MKLNLRQKYGTVNKAVAVELLYCMIHGDSDDASEWTSTLAEALEPSQEAVDALYEWARRVRAIAYALEYQARATTRRVKEAKEGKGQ
jgi:hypothetical protein